VTGSDPQLDSLLAYLKETRGFDFTGYKRASLGRQLNRRMAQVGIAGYTDYFDYLQVHPEEFTPLFNSLFINVTGYFRDPDAWTYLQDQVLPDLLGAKEATAPVRVWSAGCASGEEAYTLAIILTSS
jgi:two-component system, chemotaxis family, CheB/CheR fusion protein